MKPKLQSIGHQGSATLGHAMLPSHSPLSALLILHNASFEGKSFSTILAVQQTPALRSQTSYSLTFSTNFYTHPTFPLTLENQLFFLLCARLILTWDLQGTYTTVLCSVLCLALLSNALRSQETLSFNLSLNPLVFAE